MKRRSFAPTAEVFLEEAKGLATPGAVRGLRQLRALERVAREVRKHAYGNTTRPRKGLRGCRCSGPRECMLRIVDVAGKVEGLF